MPNYKMDQRMEALVDNPKRPVVIIVCGERGAGKTTWIERFVEDHSSIEGITVLPPKKWQGSYFMGQVETRIDAGDRIVIVDGVFPQELERHNFFSEKWETAIKYVERYQDREAA